MEGSPWEGDKWKGVPGQEISGKESLCSREVEGCYWAEMGEKGVQYTGTGEKDSGTKEKIWSSYQVGILKNGGDSVWMEVLKKKYRQEPKCMILDMCSEVQGR